MLNGRRILVTGGCGHSGSIIVTNLLENYTPESVSVFDYNEHGLFTRRRELSEHHSRVRFIYGDIRDIDRLDAALKDIDVVIHTAGLKHVGLSEYHPNEAVQTNFIGTHNVIKSSFRNDVSRVIGLSTDKAVEPVSTMGASKMLAERLLIAANQYEPDSGPIFGAVRLGNIIGSHGSVVPILMNQIRNGGPVTITDKEMTRFVLSGDESSSFIIDVLQKMTGGEVFVPKLPAFKVSVLVEAMIDEYAPDGVQPESIDIEITGGRPGERPHEILISSSEVDYSYDLDEMFVVTPQIRTLDNSQWSVEGEPCAIESYSSEDADFLEKQQLLDLIEHERPI